MYARHVDDDDHYWQPVPSIYMRDWLRIPTIQQWHAGHVWHAIRSQRPKT